MAIIAKNAYKEGRVTIPVANQEKKDSELSKEGRKCQRDAQDKFYCGKQRRLPHSVMPEYEEARQKRNAATRLRALERSHMRNFYALDTETSGFDHNEPIQIGVVLFEDGKPKKHYN